MIWVASIDGEPHTMPLILMQELYAAPAPVAETLVPYVVQCIQETHNNLQRKKRGQVQLTLWGSS